MTLRYLLGIDIGTSGLKSVLIDEVGQLLAFSFREYIPDLPQPDWAEQDPDVWLTATISAMCEMTASSGVDQRMDPNSLGATLRLFDIDPCCGHATTMRLRFSRPDISLSV